MDREYFTLIYGDKIATAPQTKVIPADSFSKLLTSKELIECVKEDAEKYRKEVITECELLKEQAQKEGFAAGFEKWTKKLAELETEIGKVKEELNKVVAPIALKAAKKIVGEQIDVSEETIFSIIKKCLKGVAQHKKITIYVNQEELPKLESRRPKIAEMFESLESLSLRPREDVSKGGCVIETEGGIIDARIEQQWAILEQAFRAIPATACASETEEVTQHE